MIEIASSAKHTVHISLRSTDFTYPDMVAQEMFNTQNNLRGREEDASYSMERRRGIVTRLLDEPRMRVYKQLFGELNRAYILSKSSEREREKSFLTKKVILFSSSSLPSRTAPSLMEQFYLESCVMSYQSISDSSTTQMAKQGKREIAPLLSLSLSLTWLESEFCANVLSLRLVCCLYCFRLIALKHECLYQGYYSCNAQSSSPGNNLSRMSFRHFTTKYRSWSECKQCQCPSLTRTAKARARY